MAPQQLCRNVVLAIIFTGVIGRIECAKIILFTPPVNGGSKSHRHIMTALGETLVNNGHDVTIVLQGVEKTDSKLLKTIHASSPYDKAYFDELAEDMKEFSASIETGKEATVFGEKFQKLIETECRTLLSDNELFTRLRTENFDLAIVDHYYNCGFVAASKLKLKYIVLECSSSVSLVMDIPGVPSPLSYVPAFMSGQTDDMDFLGRTKNLLLIGVTSFFFKSWMKPWEEIALELGDSGKSLQELKSNGELWLINNDFSLEYPRPLLPNTIFIGGLLARPPKPVSKEIQEYIKNAGNKGVVLVSFGSVVDFTLAPNLTKVLLNALGSLDQRVIWAAKSRPVGQTIPANIKFWDWIPQNDILGHPEVKAFVTHGGINSIWESIYHGVPTLVITATMDAMDNALRLEKKGMGLIEQPVGITTESVAAKLHRLITEESFKTNARRLSAVMQNQPQTPAQRISFWVDYALKFKGVDHLKTSAANLSFIQYHMLDVWAVISFVVLCLFALIGQGCRFCYKRCCKSKLKQQ